LILAGRKHIEALVDRYRREIRSKDSGFTLARELYGLLLGSIQEIKKSPRITIIADGKLHLLPFEALVFPEGDYLIVSHLVDYSPSATVFCMTRRESATRRAKLPFLGIGDVPQTLQNGETFFQLKNVRLNPLPASKDEVIAISELVGNRSIQLLGEHATEAALKALPLSEFQILHFALHGISSERMASRSALVLAPNSETGEDGLLEASEISTLDLNSDLVVLSGCDTGRGDPLQADGVVANLARSFLLAGAKTVVASLWGADDYYTRTLMKRFYSYLVQGMDKGSALRLAKLALINFYGREKALPVYWAGFVMIGESSTPVFPEP
jgi:CHAT domain-containing protein